jgi:hypothetical protein
LEGEAIIPAPGWRPVIGSAGYAVRSPEGNGAGNIAKAIAVAIAFWKNILTAIFVP